MLAPDALGSIIGRDHSLFAADMQAHEDRLASTIVKSKFLVLGAAGSIGAAVTKALFRRQPKKLHAVDISENNLVELVRDIRSSLGYIPGDFQTFALDVGALEYDVFFQQDGDYDYILNFAALKHVRSEADPYTLMRLIKVNILNTEKTLKQAQAASIKNYFSVSSDKASNPVNLMGASKRAMELLLFSRAQELPITTARFANVAFSDGSLLHSFYQRLFKRQPLVAPDDIERYFISASEAAELCLLACLLGENRDIFFPKPSHEFHLMKFSELADRFLRLQGYEPYFCQDETEAKEAFASLIEKKRWPCLLSQSDTTGEKAFEEFYTGEELLDLDRFKGIGLVKYKDNSSAAPMDWFLEAINEFRYQKKWNKKQLVELFQALIPNFTHIETNHYLNDKM